ncbi:stage III sporulation protein AF [Ectobacillus ponti]|uniref:Stage III sporulation protein AF n=1 Tax=Ectobacillus ponti TaxID=2961894 RepID=A0AA41X158_9BACI|nr:stage III sporulation protein AF [Ectobacillus ponti]MCP8967056.1 stage III sporulation protein AF [Ectobacillus ponti]
MEFLTEWIRNIILFLLLATVMHMILPNSGMQKYVKFVVSLLLIVLILTPLFKLLRTDVGEVIASFNSKTYANGTNVENLIDAKKKEIQASQRAYILQQMAVQLKEQVADKVQGEYGMSVVKLHITAPDGKDISSEQDVQSIAVTVAKADKRPRAVEAVKPVEIDTAKPRSRQVDNQTAKEIQQFLAKEWQLDAGKIQVQTEGGTEGANE